MQVTQKLQDAKGQPSEVLLHACNIIVHTIIMHVAKTSFCIANLSVKIQMFSRLTMREYFLKCHKELCQQSLFYLRLLLLVIKAARLL